jgi:hypothetical protein
MSSEITDAARQLGKRKRDRLYSKLPPETERELVKILLDAKARSTLSFKRLCDEREHIFGAKGSCLRKKVQKRRQYLLKHRPALDLIASKLLVASPTPVKPHIEAVFENTAEKLDLSSLQVTPSTGGPTPRRQLFKSPLFKSPQERPKPIMAEAKKIPQITLSFNRPWAYNTGGIMAVKGVNYEDSTTRQVVDKLSIYKPIFDIEDMKSKRYAARISQDGGGIIVTEPSVPQFLWEDADGIQNLVDGSNVCTVTRLSYRVHGTRFAENDEIRTTEVEYRLEDGITINNEFFNQDCNGAPPATPFLLEPKMVVQKRVLMTDRSGNDVVDFMPFVVWKMAIDGEDARTSVKKTSPTDCLADAFDRLGIHIGTSGKP